MNQTPRMDQKVALIEQNLLIQIGKKCTSTRVVCRLAQHEIHRDVAAVVVETDGSMLAIVLENVRLIGVNVDRFLVIEALD